MSYPLRKWLSDAQDIYREYLSKPYTLKTCNDDWEITIQDVTIPRPNHGLCHTLRVASYVSIVVKVYNFFNKTSISSVEVENLELAMLFYVVGRENEVSFYDPNYLRFRQKSASAFEKYAREKFSHRFTEEQLQFYKKGIYDSYSASCHPYFIIQICHDLDLLRCLSRKDYEKKLVEISKLIGPIFRQLAGLAEECLHQTGDRVTLNGNYNKPIFKICSQNVEECLRKIDKAFQIKQGEIMIKVDTKEPFPPGLRNLLPNPATPWHFNPELFKKIQSASWNSPSKEFKIYEVNPKDPEYAFILRYFMQMKPSGLGIKRVVCIHNPTQTRNFEVKTASIEQETKNPTYDPKGAKEEPKISRAKALKRWQNFTDQFLPLEVFLGDREHPLRGAKVLPLWHGTSSKVCQSICSSGFTYFGKHHYFTSSAKAGANESTDLGYFGSGIYFTNSARYASRYGEQLILTWVAMREPYPVVSDMPHPNKCSDMIKLQKGQIHYQNYNTHFIPVESIRPSDPECLEYYPCFGDQPPAWDEFVVFEKSQTLPRFWLELGVDFPKPLPLPHSSPGEADYQEGLKFEKLKDFKKAFLAYQKAAEVSHFCALMKMSKFYAKGKGVDKDKEKAVEFIKKGSDEYHKHQKFYDDKDDPDVVYAIYRLAYDLDSYVEDCDQKEITNLYQKAAVKGHPKAQCSFAIRLKNGCGIKKDIKKALEWYLKSAEQGYYRAQMYLGAFYENGEDLAQDYKKASEWYGKAISYKKISILDSWLALKLGKWYMEGKKIPRDYKKGAECFQRVCEINDNNSEAFFRLGLCYEEGKGVAVNKKEALQCYLKAEDQWWALMKLGEFYERGIEVPEDRFKAAQLYQKGAEEYKERLKSCPFDLVADALLKLLQVMEYHNRYYIRDCNGEIAPWINKVLANKDDNYDGKLGQEIEARIKQYHDEARSGNLEAKFRLGLFYYHGWGVPKDVKKGFNLIEESNDPRALHLLGTYYHFGIGISANYEKTLEYYNKASVHRAEALVDLGFCCDSNSYFNASAEYYRKAALKGSPIAQYKYGLCLLEGKGVTFDIRQAFEFFEKSANQSFPPAFVQLGICYKEGIGVSANFEEGFKWFDKADRAIIVQRRSFPSSIESDWREECIGLWQGEALMQLGYCHEGDPNESFFQYLNKVYLNTCILDLVKAEKYFRQAFEWYKEKETVGIKTYGLKAEVFYKLGLCYENGLGTEKNLSLAIKWYSNAASGHPKAAEKVLVLKKQIINCRSSFYKL